jgi:hypothetical protein
MQDLEYEDEELDEIDYLEILSFDEIVKINPTFVEFNDEQIENYLLSFFKSTNKSKAFLNLFNNIINKQRNPSNTKNFIVVIDAKRGNFTEGDSLESFILDNFINKIKDTSKEEIKFSYKSKNKIWFPLIYDDETTKIKFTATNKTIVQLSTNDYYIIYKDDERDIPVISVYFCEPNVDDNSYLNEKIGSHLIKSINKYKGEILSGENYKSFDDLMKDYKIPLPLNKIDENEYDYSNLSNLFKKFNYDLDFINLNDFELLKSHLIKLNNKEKIVNITYSSHKIKEKNLKNSRFLFYEILKKTNDLIHITFKFAKKFQNDLDTIQTEKNFIEQLPIHKDLNLLINNINNENFEEIIKNLRDIRKNISIDNSILVFQKYLNLKPEEIDLHFNKIEKKFNLLINAYKDIYKIDFTFEQDEKEIIKGNDMSNYEGLPEQIGELKNDILFDDDDEPIPLNEKDLLDDLNKYYNNQYYILEKGFHQSLKDILPFIIKIKEYSKLPINLDGIVNHLFNIHRGIPEKYILIREKYKDIYDEEHCKEQALKPVNVVLNNEHEDKLLKDANIEYVNIITNMLYDVICKWSIELQKELIDETLLYDNEIYYIPCYDLWNDVGCPYDIKAKDGIFYYLLCIFANVFKENYSDNYSYNYLPLDKNYKSKIFERLINNYSNELQHFEKIDLKKKKTNKGIEAQKELVKFLQNKDYKNDKFFETFIQSLIYMPSVKFQKIHKYLLGCCLEVIDENFTADNFFKTNRKDLEKAKSKFSSQRVLNEKRNIRFYLSKEEIIEKSKKFKAINYENLLYPIYENSLEKWFEEELDETTILNQFNITDIKTKLLYSYNIHINEYLKIFGKKPDLIKNYSFNNYKQILLYVSKILFLHLNENALNFVKKINKTIHVLDKLNSIINDNNETAIQQIRTIIVIRAICLPAIPEIKSISNLQPSINISNELYKKIFSDIKTSIFKIIENYRIPTVKEQRDYIDKMREKNKENILAKLNKKTQEEFKLYNQFKQIGIKLFEEEEDISVEINKEITDDVKDIQGENEFNLGVEDDENDYFEKDDMGFIYA